MRVVVLRANSAEDIQQMINATVDRRYTTENVMDIKFGFSVDRGYSSYSAMVIFDDTEGKKDG